MPLALPEKSLLLEGTVWDPMTERTYEVSKHPTSNQQVTVRQSHQAQRFDVVGNSPIPEISVTRTERVGSSKIGERQYSVGESYSVGKSVAQNERRMIEHRERVAQMRERLGPQFKDVVADRVRKSLGQQGGLAVNEYLDREIGADNHTSDE